MAIKNTTENLFKKASQAQKKAYAPYSRFKVGAAILAGSGRVYTGCNVENGSLGLSICAERVALFKAVSEGERVYRQIAISSSQRQGVTPCGACLQTLAEFAPDIKIIYRDKRGDIKTKGLEGFLSRPFVFGRKDTRKEMR